MQKDDLIYRQAVIDTIKKSRFLYDAMRKVTKLPPAQTKIAENLYPYKCFITDKDGLQHEVIHTGDIRRVTGWEI